MGQCCNASISYNVESICGYTKDSKLNDHNFDKINYIYFLFSLVYADLCNEDVHGDGVCDLHYNIPVCNFDSNDCSYLQNNSGNNLEE